MESELQKLFTEYENECRYSARLSSETVRGYSAVFQLFMKVMPEVITLKDLTTAMLSEYFKRIETRQRKVGKATIKTGVKKSTIKTHWSKLNVFFDWLDRKRLIDKNPLVDIPPPRVRYDDFRRLEVANIDKIRSAITRCSINPLLNRRDNLMVSLLLSLGLRKGEFISLQVKDIDLIKRLVTIRGETSKSKRTKILPISPTLLLHFKDYFLERNRLNLKTEFLLVSNRGDRGLSRDGLKHWVKSLIKKSGVKFHLHMFRHTFACLLTEKGTPSLLLKELMGHSSIAMTAKYTRSLKAENMYEEICKISL